MVYLHIPNLLKQGTSEKLQPICVGPYLVCRFQSKYSVILLDILSNKLLKRAVHVDCLMKVQDVRNNTYASRLVKHYDATLHRKYVSPSGLFSPHEGLLVT